MKQKSFSIFLLFVFSFILVSCVNDNVEGRTITRTEAGNTLIVAPEFSAVILSKKFLESGQGFGFEKYWTPKVEQILYIESNLEQYLAQQDSRFNSGHAPGKEKLREYARQYFGIFSDGKPVIIGSFICSTFSKDHDWKNRAVSVFGGGDCFFGVFYEPKSKAFFGVIANSPK